MFSCVLVPWTLRLKLNEWIRCLSGSPAMLRLLTSTICVWFSKKKAYFFYLTPAFTCCTCVGVRIFVLVCVTSHVLCPLDAHTCASHLTRFMDLLRLQSHPSRQLCHKPGAKWHYCDCSRYNQYLRVYLYTLLICNTNICISVCLHSTWTTMTVWMRWRVRRWVEHKME